MESLCKGTLLFLKLITSDKPIKSVHVATDRFLKINFFFFWATLVCEQVCVCKMYLCCVSVAHFHHISILGSDKNRDKSDL